ncbi:hypothetical protein GLOIN_2v1777724 [Rhizophagus clarus]|uniref:Uncharacterized protein n=1 Tax=Rhizophagus clarus TaxID=94130 RepID=A0A8H3QR14_9GLOM|nr:hypothetical protein GLOIN_2v1777724 [Rhizophagus clarus]
MDIPELNIQESLFSHTTSHKEQVERNDIISQNPESESKVITFPSYLSVSRVFRSWEDVDTIMKAYVLTTFDNLHNHMLFPNIEEYLPKYRCISDNILKEAKFSDQSILDRDLANAIQKFKVKKDVAYDTSHLLKTLIQHKTDDPGWFVKFQLDEENKLI